METKTQKQRNRVCRRALRSQLRRRQPLIRDVVGVGRRCAAVVLRASWIVAGAMIDEVHDGWRLATLALVCACLEAVMGRSAEPEPSKQADGSAADEEGDVKR